MKIIIFVLTITTIASVVFASYNTEISYDFTQIIPKGSLEIGFLIAFLGWMPSPLDLSVIHSLWAIEKKNESKDFNTKKSILDFNVGYFTTIFLGICFVSLGYFVMFGSGETFSNSAGGFAQQLIDLYTKSIGNWAFYIIAIAAFTTMFSTTLTTLDASPRLCDNITCFSKVLEKRSIKLG